MISGADSRNGSGTSSSGTLDYDYSYDYLWRLTEASLPGTDDWAEKGITYDRNGNLRSLTRHGGSGSVLDALNLSFESSVFDGGVIQSGGVRYFTRDHLGNTRVVTDGSGNVVERNDYYPFGERHSDSSMPTVNSNRWRFAGEEIQPLGSTGWLDFGARQYDSFLGRWTTLDPLAEKYPGISPYSYCAGNPINLVDRDGNSLSTHTDKYGVVQKVIDDGDLGVYRHDGDAEQTISELDSSYSSDYTSGGGELMGKSLHALSFVDMNKYHSTGVVESLPIKIDFESNELTDMVTRELEKDYSVMNYQRLAAPGGALDSKSKINNGSKLFDTYASPRDAGNFLAGMYAASKGTFGPVIMYGYGAYNLCGNNKAKTAIFCLFSLMSTRPPAAVLINYTYHHGEDELSHLGQMLGFNYYKNNYAR